MKKFAVISILLIFCAAFFAGCNFREEKGAYDLYRDLYKKMNKAKENLKSVDMDISVATEYTVFLEPTDVSSGESRTTETINGNLKQVRKSDSDADMEMNFEKQTSWYTSGLNGHSVHLAFNSYYTGGIYYEILTFNGQKGPGTKKPMTAEAVLKQIGYTGFIEYPESAIKDCKITDLNDGKKMELNINGEWMTGQILEYMRNTYPSPELNEASLTFNEFICEFLIDKNNIMKSCKMTYDISVTAVKEEGRLVTEINMAVNSYNSVTIDLPLDLDTYIDSE